MSKIAYEPHPVTPERKAELRKQGKIIIDAIYKPADLVAEEAGQPAPALTREAIDTMSRRDVVQHLEAHGVDGATGKVADLRNWLKQVVFI